MKLTTATKKYTDLIGSEYLVKKIDVKHYTKKLKTKNNILLAIVVISLVAIAVSFTLVQHYLDLIVA